MNHGECGRQGHRLQIEQIRRSQEDLGQKPVEQRTTKAEHSPEAIGQQGQKGRHLQRLNDDFDDGAVFAQPFNVVERSFGLQFRRRRRTNRVVRRGQGPKDPQFRVRIAVDQLRRRIRAR